METGPCSPGSILAALSDENNDIDDSDDEEVICIGSEAKRLVNNIDRPIY